MDLEISPTDPNILASASADSSIRIWSLDPKHRQQPLACVLAGEGHRETVLTLVSPVKCIIHPDVSNPKLGIPCQWAISSVWWDGPYREPCKILYSYLQNLHSPDNTIHRSGPCPSCLLNLLAQILPSK